MQDKISAFPDASEFIHSLNSSGDVAFDFTWDPGSAESLFRPVDRVQLEINGVRRECRITGAKDLPDGTVDVEFELVEDATHV